MNRLGNGNLVGEDKYFGLSHRIARWKQPSEFEQRLSEAAGKSHTDKTLYVDYYKQLDPEYYEKGRRFAQELFEPHSHDYVGMSFDEVYEDMVYCLHRYGLSFQDYLIYSLHKKSEFCRQQFVADKLRYYYCDLLNGEEVEKLMTNKYRCYETYKSFFKREVIPVTSESDRILFYDFLSRHKKFIYKPLNDHSGHGISVLDSDEIDSEKWFEERVRNCPGVVEELIQQGAEMNAMNPSAINSCRVMTFKIDSEVIFLGVTLRMGVGKGVTDNAGAGGIYASVDPVSGIIQSDAKNYKNQHFLFHPSTGRQIIGFQLPEWTNAMSLVKAMANYRPDTVLIAWDIAYSDRGWCMVEANESGDWSILQSNFEIGKKKELYDLMDKYSKYKLNEA